MKEASALSEHNGCPAEGWFGLFLKLATPYDVSQTHAIRYSLTECTCSVLCACCLPAFGSRGRISPRGGAVMSTTRPQGRTCTTNPEVESPRLDRGGARRREGEIASEVAMDVRAVDEEEESSDEEDDE